MHEAPVRVRAILPALRYLQRKRLAPACDAIRKVASGALHQQRCGQQWRWAPCPIPRAAPLGPLLPRIPVFMLSAEESSPTSRPLNLSVQDVSTTSPPAAQDGDVDHHRARALRSHLPAADSPRRRGERRGLRHVKALASASRLERDTRQRLRRADRGPLGSTTMRHLLGRSAARRRLRAGDPHPCARVAPLAILQCSTSRLPPTRRERGRLFRR